MSNEPDAVEGFVSYEQNHDDPALKAPHEAEALAAVGGDGSPSAESTGYVAES